MAWFFAVLELFEMTWEAIVKFWKYFCCWSFLHPCTSCTTSTEQNFPLQICTSLVWYYFKRFPKFHWRSTSHCGDTTVLINSSTTTTSFKNSPLNLWRTISQQLLIGFLFSFAWLRDNSKLFLSVHQVLFKCRQFESHYISTFDFSILIFLLLLFFLLHEPSSLKQHLFFLFGVFYFYFKHSFKALSSRSLLSTKTKKTQSPFTLLHWGINQDQVLSLKLCAAISCDWLIRFASFLAWSKALFKNFHLIYLLWL